MAGEEAPPYDEGEEAGQHPPHESVFGRERLAPVVPIGRQQAEADGDEMLLEFEDAVGRVHAELLEYRAHRDAVGRIEDRAYDTREREEHDDRMRIDLAAHAAEA